MLDGLLGGNMYLKFFSAFAVVLALIGLTAWLVRRFGSNRLGGNAARGRQPRLAVIDAAPVDGRRRLVLIRRDNVEHLLMIGGPSDIVVEQNIVRAIGAGTRESARIEPAVRAAPPVEGNWPLQPVTEPAPIPAPRPYRTATVDEAWPEPAPRNRSADSLTGLAAELSARLNPPDHAPPPPARASAMAPPAHEPPPQPQNDQNLAEMAQQLEAALRRGPATDSRPPVTDPLAVNPAGNGSVMPPRTPARDFKPRAEPKFDTKFDAKFDAKFDSKREPRAEPRSDPRTDPRNDLRPEPRSEFKFDPKLDNKNEPRREPAAPPGKQLYENLEDEMASLLGRPSGKT